ncbi:hypothetical protein H6F43_03845 [Leptolyngbya sp. FACHB-36]|uniref:SNF2-related protein n=1 Tax=Leptolyngbya sp. FACHB-36 TaxID=2692808 RepID=UPI001680B32A|nr:SNF2-related protein [Leptolyngbya sp. FACHB-36]MBD2019315.1 hypothetical protein [Leptolyngbya sp. FACHB-36]
MQYVIGTTSYRVVESAGQLLLRKDVGQFNLFGGVDLILPKGRKRKGSTGHQLPLFDTSPVTLKPKTPKAPKALKPKGSRKGERKTVNGITYELNENSRWAKVKMEPVRSAVVDKPIAPVAVEPVPVEPTAPEPTIKVDSPEIPDPIPPEPTTPEPTAADITQTEPEETEVLEALTKEPIAEQIKTFAEPPLGTNADYTAVKGRKTRQKRNQQVKNLLAQKQSGFTELELQLLASYSGRGGIGTDDVSLNEYYTRSDVAEFAVDLLYRHGFQGGTLLEPSCGAGVFLRHGSREGVKVIGVEADETSSQIAAAVNPDADVVSDRFERFCLDNADTGVDAIVGNVPFGVRLTTSDFKANGFKPQWKANEDLFVDASLDMLLPEGMMALIVPHGVVSGADHMSLRQELVKKGRVVGAYRLPESAFKHSDTSVITDLLLVQKHPTSVLNAIVAGDEAAIAATADSTFVGGGYFDANPQNVLGTVGTRQRGTRAALSVKGDLSAEILNSAPELAPTVAYEGLETPRRDRVLQPGDERFINGTRYRLNENHRWERVDDLTADHQAEAEQSYDPSAFGTDSLAEAEANLEDIGKRVLIAPDALTYYLELAKNSLDSSEVDGIKAALSALNAAGGSADREKIAHAVLLAHHLQDLQQVDNPDPLDLQRGLALLQDYRERYGNPATDKALSAIALQHSALLVLQGAFSDDGKISDYFAEPEKVAEVIDRTAQESPLAAMNEAFRASGGEPVGLEEIKGYFPQAITDEDLAAALLNDPTIGYSNGTYQPLNRLLVGNGYEVIAQFADEAEVLPERSPARRKLELQIAEVRSRLEPRSLENMTTPLWAVGSWISVEAFNAFMKERDYAEVRLTDKGFVAAKGDRGYLTSFEQDVVTAMNRGRISHGSKTKEAKEAIAAFEQEFAAWLAGSSYRLDVEEAYNSAFNGELLQEYSGEPLGDVLNCLNADKLHHYQASTIRQMAEQGRGIISLGVGLGKTASAIVLSQYLKQRGQAQKPCVVVPKSVLANWVREVGFWASGANVLVVGQTQQFWADGSPAWEVPGHAFKMRGGNPVKDADGNFLLSRTDDPDKTPIAMSEAEVAKVGNFAFRDDDAATKERKLQQLSQNACDLVIMSEPVFQGIGLTPDREFEEMQELMGRHINDESSANKKKLYELQQRKEAKLADLASRRGEKTENMTWESLGVDCLMHDEAHHLKNLFGTVRTGDVAFLSQAESNRALDFYYKSKFTRENNNNQNVYLLTATPTTNNPLEAFNMLSHVCPEEFDRRGIQNVDDFLQMFGKTETVTVPGVDLEMTQKNGLVGFKNLKDLRKLFGKYCRMQSARDVGLPIPEEKAQDVFVEMTAAQKQVYDGLRQRAKEMIKPGVQSDDHIFSVISDMDKAAIDLEYYNATRSDYGEEAEIPEAEKSPKIQSAVDRVMASRAGSRGKQIVFCDANQLHETLKQQLVAAGYPESEIQIVNAKTVSKSSDRQKVSQAYNDGRISLVIGNTATMGEGMNFQVGTTDIHHLTTPWTPSAIEQRNGRGVRQGNKLDEVNVHYYHANASFDHYRKGTVERKRGWIDELWKGTEDEVVNQNTGGLSMDEIAIALADDPEATRKAMLSNREAQMAKLREVQTKQSLRQFGQLQTMRQALNRMGPDKKSTPAGAELQERMRQSAAALNRNEFFPYKHLLDGAEPAYVGADGTVIASGHHLEMRDGSVVKVTGVDVASQKIMGVPVMGPNHRPFNFDQDSPVEVGFKQINRASGLSAKPTSFNQEERDRAFVAAANRYEHLKHLTPELIDANRTQLLRQMREDGAYDRVPYIDEAGDTKLDYLAKIPESAQVLFPHDGGAVDRVIRAMATDDRASYRFNSVLEAMTGRKFYGDLEPEVRAKIQQYRSEAPEAKEGDRKTEGGVTYELQDSRWRRVDEMTVETVEPVAPPTPAAAEPEIVEPETPVPASAVPAPVSGGVPFEPGSHMDSYYQQLVARPAVKGLVERFKARGLTAGELDEFHSDMLRDRITNAVELLRHAGTPVQDQLIEALMGKGQTPSSQTAPETPATTEATEIDQAKLQQARHAKRNVDLHVVSLKERVSRDRYRELEQRAKSMGGWYSSYSKLGAIPGFQFESEDAAKQFMNSLTKSVYQINDARYTPIVLPSGLPGFSRSLELEFTYAVRRRRA